MENYFPEIRNLEFQLKSLVLLSCCLVAFARLMRGVEYAYFVILSPDLDGGRRKMMRQVPQTAALACSKRLHCQSSRI